MEAACVRDKGSGRFQGNAEGSEGSYSASVSVLWLVVWQSDRGGILNRPAGGVGGF